MTRRVARPRSGSSTSGAGTPGSREVHVVGRARPVGRRLCGAGRRLTKSQSPRTRGDVTVMHEPVDPVPQSSMPRHRGRVARLGAHSRDELCRGGVPRTPGDGQADRTGGGGAAVIPTQRCGFRVARRRSRRRARLSGSRATCCPAASLAAHRTREPCPLFASGCPPSASTSSAPQPTPWSVDASICSDTECCRSAIPSTGTSIRCGVVNHRSCTGVGSMRSIRRWWATARSSGN